MDVLSPCLACGEPTQGTRCDRCRPQFVNAEPPSKGSPRSRGYDANWDKISKRARSRQNWCTDCGSVEDLTADHSPEAWRRHAAGLPIRLKDIDVVCRRCNADRGRQRPEDPGGIPAGHSAGTPWSQFKFQSHTTDTPGGGP